MLYPDCKDDSSLVCSHTHTRVDRVTMNPPTALSAAPVPILQLHINHPMPDKVTLAQDAAAPDSSQCCRSAENVGLLLFNPPPPVSSLQPTSI